MNREQEKRAELQAAIDNGSIDNYPENDPIWEPYIIRTPCCSTAITRDTDHKTQCMEPRGYDVRCRKPDAAIQEDLQAQQEIEMEDEEYSRRMDHNQFENMQQQRNNLQQIEN